MTKSTVTEGSGASQWVRDDNSTTTPAAPQSHHTAEKPYADETQLAALSQMRRQRSTSNIREHGLHDAALTGNDARGTASAAMAEGLQGTSVDELNRTLAHGTALDTQILRHSDMQVGKPTNAPHTSNTKAFPAVTVPQKIENQKKPVLIYDFVSPSRLRSTDGDLSDLGEFNRQGLDRISMTGVEQFSEEQLDNVIRAVHPKKVVMIDTRQESHGFIGGRPISWMATDNRNWGNVDKAVADIEPKEEKKLRKLAIKSDGATINIPYGSTAKEKSETEPLRVKVRRSRVETEKQLVERKGGIYLRVPVPDHAAPDLDTLDHFSRGSRAVVQEHGLSNVHFVVHCRGGMGRTTLLMSALDMLVNAPQVSLDDIVDRQVKIRRRDESPLTAPGKEYKRKFREEKSEVLRAFHQYAAANSFSAPQAIPLKAWAEEPAISSSVAPDNIR